MSRVGQLLAAATSHPPPEGSFVWSVIGKDTFWTISAEELCTSSGIPEHCVRVAWGTNTFVIHYDVERTQVRDANALLCNMLQLPPHSHGLHPGELDDECNALWDTSLLHKHAVRFGEESTFRFVAFPPDSVRVTVLMSCGDDDNEQKVWQGHLRCSHSASSVVRRMIGAQASLAKVGGLTLFDCSGDALDADSCICSHHDSHSMGRSLLFEVRSTPFANRLVAAVGICAAPGSVAEKSLLVAAGLAFAAPSTPLIAGEEDSCNPVLRFPASRILNAALSHGRLVLTALRLIFDPDERSTYSDAHDASISVPLRCIYRMDRGGMGASTLLLVVFRTGKVCFPNLS